MKKLIVIAAFLLSSHCYAYIEGDVYTFGQTADNQFWECGFWMKSLNRSQNVKVWYWIELSGQYYYITEKGFAVSSEKAPYDTIFLYQNERVDVPVLNFVWPENSMPEFSHFWIWFQAKAASGDTIYYKTSGQTYWGKNGHYQTRSPTPPLYTSTPTPTPLTASTPTPIPTSTPTPKPTTGPTAFPNCPKWFKIKN